MQKGMNLGGRGGFTCCVPGCFSNSNRDVDLSFYVIPNGKSKEKILLRKKWLHMISRKDFQPTDGHRVCSKHFVGGRKTYMNNVPTLVPKMKGKENLTKRRVINRKPVDSLPVDSQEHFDASGSDDDEKSDISECNATAPFESEKEKLLERIKALEIENESLKSANDKASEQIVFLEHRINEKEFCVENFKNNSKLFRFYTGIPDYTTFEIVFQSFGSAVNSLVYIGTNTNSAKLSSADHIKRGPKRVLKAEQEFFLVLVRLRLGLLEEDIASRAGISSSHFSRIWVTWLDFLHSKFRTYPIWPTKACVQQTMPKWFKEIYPSVRVIIDCTEIFIEKPNSVKYQSQTYSNYKHHNTAKGLIGISPSGAVSFVSDLYSGRTSDKQLTKSCGILKLLEQNDSLMADRGFDIAEDLPDGVHLNIPPFLRGKEQLSAMEEAETRQIASVRIHVERAICRVKTFRILNTVFPIAMGADLNKIWIICCYLINFLPPIIGDESS